MRHIGTISLVCFCWTTASFAHYNMLLPATASAKKGEKITFTYQFGHPFENELSDAPKPVALKVFKPRGAGQEIDIEKNLLAIMKTGADGKQARAWQFTYTPAERGDYTFVLKTDLIKHDENTFVQDIVKVVLHVQTQNGWDAEIRSFHGLDIWPYTRPYGLLPGMVFRGRVVSSVPDEFFMERDFQIRHGLPIEIEKYNEKPPKKLPPDELITFKAKTESNGFFVTTFPEAGWWSVTALAQSKTKEKGKNQIHRTTFWVHVDEKK